MTKSFKTEGVILRRRDFGEADRLLTVFTLHQGKVTVLAKGVRRITSRRSGNVELLNRAQIFLHQGKNFLILTEASSVDVYENIKNNLTLTTYAYHVIELIDKLMPENSPDLWVYENLVHVLSLLNTTARQIYIRAFEAKLLSHLGFVNFADPSLSSHISSGKLNIEEVLIKLEGLSWNEIEKITVNEQQALELERILRYHIERIIEGQLKSRRFLKNNGQ